MNTVQLIAAVIAFVSLLAAIIAGAWINQRGLERQMEAFRNEIKAELNAMRADIKGDIGELRAEVRAQGARIERIEKLIEPFVTLVAPGKGD
jgi:CHASE1-domain containing sensor protein